MGIDVADLEEPEAELNEHPATTRTEADLSLREKVQIINDESAVNLVH